ncbi:rRNA maturation RNase YbeY [Alteromonas sediminis]|uniref:Endoribonuclease YbeY n=2 Tax=Alteromonas sediminis TaxID=2259342 RepID=A0A3N5YNH0_9ALTE|nr:rRNA maturation RNase YbeY [Alteromonas sediminis]
MSEIIVDIQQALSNSDASVLPSPEQLQHWVACVLNKHDTRQHEITIRFVEAAESQELNSTYRGKNKPTNVLSFPFEHVPDVPIPLLGDLVICVPVIIREASEQNKTLQAHFAHMIIHGTLHLLGYDHIQDEEAEEMESLEIQLLAELGIDDPYQDH